MKRALGSALAHLVLIAFSAAIVLPLLWVLRVSLTDKLTAYRIPPEWTVPDPANFIEIFTAYPFATWFLNSLVVGVGSTLVALPLAAGLAYAFARYGTGGSSLRLAVLASQMLPPVVLVLPLFAIFLTAGLLNTYAALITAHVALNLPFLTWMLIAFFQGELRELEEAARIEGA